MIYYLIRHGETESNLKRIYAGWNKEELTIKGRNQIVDLAKRLTSLEIDQIYTSPIKRALQTAQIIGYFLKITPIVEERLKELRLGIWQGMHEDEVARQYPEEWKIWNTRPAELVLDGRETLHELLERVLSGLQRIAAAENKGNVAVITHVAVIRVLQLYFGGRSLNDYRKLPVPANGCVLEFEFQNSDKQCT
jgi:broad specificity phosphatase PhoE